MQTFLPYPSFNESAEVLDDRRLGKQRVEALQLTYALLGIGPDFEPRDSAWRNHPAAKMWWGHCRSLICYGMVCCLSWKARGFTDSVLQSFVNLQENAKWIANLYPIEKDKVIKPRWVGDANFHRAHQSNLVRKDADYYSPKFPDVPNNLPYIWPEN